jgi:hypothetical protein
MPTVLTIAVVASLLVSLYTVLHVFMLLNSIRKESRKSYEVASHIQEDWDRFSAREEAERQRLAERYERFENSTRDRVEKFETVANSTRERLIKLESYLKEFFEVELKSVFDSFDKTVSSILEEMKSELLRGIERIEDIQAFVDSKSFAQDRILDGEGSVYKLLADTSTAQREGGGESLPMQTEDDAGRDAERSPKPPFRLEPDEAE